ncbi:MAG: 16S rRNA (adenine(1518)-N(6)/adenine(1519)-N(6))-dimethyltransferase RsmA [Janthinobacterium lividum]
MDTLPPLRDIIASHDLAAKKSLGQNFLLDLNLTLKIAKTAGDLSNQTIIEVGPGPGGLTRALLKAGATSLIAIEHDPRCVRALQPLVEASEGKLQVYQGDALKYQLQDFGPGPFKIVANLPYNIATPLLIGWLQQAFCVTSMTLMFQKEVAERITALPSSKAYGRLSIISQARAKCRKLFDIPPSAFTPAPKVTSSVVEFIPYPASDMTWNFASLEAVTKAAFGQRRKMLRSSLKGTFANLEDVFSGLNLDPCLRAEDLSVADFIRLSRTLSSQ